MKAKAESIAFDNIVLTQFQRFCVLQKYECQIKLSGITCRKQKQRAQS